MLVAHLFFPLCFLGEYRHVTNFLSLFTDSLQIQVSALGKAMRIAGQFGTAGLPASAQASKETFEEKMFTGIGNIGALGLAKEEL